MNKLKTLLVIIFFCFINMTYAQWVRVAGVEGNGGIYALASNTNTVFAGTNEYGVLYSSNNGLNWLGNQLYNRTVYSLVVNGNFIFAGTQYQQNSNYYVALSTNNGANWYSTPLNKLVFSLAAKDNIVFAGTANLGVFTSTNNGTNWSQTSTLPPRTVNALAVYENYVFAGTNESGVYISTNNGINWTQSSLNNRAITSLAVNGNNLYAGTDGASIYHSTNYGLNWNRIVLNNESVKAITVSGSNIFAGSFFVSNDGGATWSQRIEGFAPDLQVLSICVINNYIFAGTDGGYSIGGGIYRRPLSEIIGIKPISEQIPINYILTQNYPNPFNPSTKIRFSIPRSSFVKLEIFDILGREVANIVNEKFSAGTYEADWQVDNFPSGIYYYKLTADNFTETKKMILIK